MIGYPADCGGILVSGGNMANILCFAAARNAKAPWDIRKEGMNSKQQMRVYGSIEMHTWIQKAADLFGLGTNSVRWISTDDQLRIDVPALRERIQEDLDAGNLPFMVIGSAGTVSTGAVDPLPELAKICKEVNLWFHVDGAYGGFAAVVPDASDDIRGLAMADSVAVDPHKWLYAPLEAGCTLVRNPQDLLNAFSYKPTYYKLVQDVVNFFELGPQNSRGFRALKVWLALRQAGREGYVKMISDDMALSREMFRVVQAHPELEAFTQGLSITTFRYVPSDLRQKPEAESYLNKLNEELVVRLQNGGEVFVSNAVVQEKYLLRACIVNFRTTLDDIHALPEIVARNGRETDSQLRSFK